MKKEIVCINIGQAGVQISNAIWELLCIEHGLDASGSMRSKNGTPNLSEDNYDLRTFFHQTSGNKFVPRAINVDLEPTVIDEIRCGPYRGLWNPNNLISSLEDAANNWARGRYTIGKRVSERVSHQISRIIRQCRQLHGFMIIFSLGGGCGAGVGSLLLDHLDAEYSKYPRMVTVVNPAPQLSSALVEPYNAVLVTANSLITQTDLVITSDNESLYSMCENNLHLPKPTFNNLNRILALLFSSFTVNFRFASASLDHDLGHLQTNLVPFPRVHFPFANYSPLISIEQHEHQLQTVSELTNMLFDPSSQMVRCNCTVGKYMTCCLQYRGLVTPREIYSSLSILKTNKTVQFVDWCPTGFKVGVSPIPPGSVPHVANSLSNVVMFSNNTAIEQIWRRLLKKFSLLYDKKCFVHWYVSEGMEEGEFKESQNAVLDIQNDYMSLNDGISDETNVNNFPFQENIHLDQETNDNNGYDEYELIMRSIIDDQTSGISHYTPREKSEIISELFASESVLNLNESHRISDHANQVKVSPVYSDGLNNVYNPYPYSPSNLSRRIV